VTLYRIQKIRRPVTVVFTGGEITSGDIFLNMTSRFRQEPQDTAEFLNEDEPFFALAQSEQQAILIAKDNVERIETPADEDEAPPAAGLQPVEVELRLVSGTMLSGHMLLETQSGRTRLLDCLNAKQDRFLRVSAADRIVLVNRRAIERAHELS
jgi:hypothetical protein